MCYIIRFFAFGNICASLNMNIVSLFFSFFSPFRRNVSRRRLQIGDREYRNRRLASRRAAARERLGSFIRMMTHLKSSAISSFFSCRFVSRSASLTEQGSIRMKVRRDLALGSSDWAVYGDRCREDFAMLWLYYAFPHRLRLISRQKLRCVIFSVSLRLFPRNRGLFT